jgi:hypothetical protein
MFHHGVRVGSEPLIRYLTCTMIVGGGIGVAHGISTTANKRDLRPAAILHDGLAGAIAGPWSPIFIPLLVSGMWPCGCPYRNLCRK